MSVCTLGLTPGLPGVVVRTSCGASMAEDVIFHIYFIRDNSILKVIIQTIELT
jgi:hypothetical protein